MKQTIYFILVFLCLDLSDLEAQLHVDNGVAMVVRGDIVINIQDMDLDNHGTIDPGTGNSIFGFTGTTDNSLRTNGTNFRRVLLDKSTGGDLTLLDNLNIILGFRFGGDGNQLILGDHNCNLSTSGSFQDYDPNNFVLVDGLGEVRKEDLADFTFPVGTAADGYYPIVITQAGTADRIGIRCLSEVLDGGTSGNPLIEGVVDFTWILSEATVGGSDLTISTQWNGSEELDQFDREDCGIAVFQNGEWLLPFNVMDAANGTDPYTRNRANITTLGAISVGSVPLLNHVQLDLTAFLQGPYSDQNSLMNDNLRDQNYLPINTPYDALAGFTTVGRGGEEQVSSSSVFSAKAQPENDIVDWVFVELRDPQSPTTVLETKAVLIQRDGDLVDLDGDSFVSIPVPDDQYVVAVRHRNHLGIRTPNALTLNSTNATAYNFSTAMSQAFGNNPMVETEPGVFSMWGGNARSEDRYVRSVIKLFPPPPLQSDRTYIIDNVLGGDPNGTFFGYSVGDVNMDGAVRNTIRLFPPPVIPSDATYIIDEVLNGDPNETVEEQ